MGIGCMDLRVWMIAEIVLVGSGGGADQWMDEGIQFGPCPGR